MNRFTNYIESQKLAKHFMLVAEESATKGDTDKAVKNLVSAMREQMTACNNIASLYFEHRKKR